MHHSQFGVLEAIRIYYNADTLTHQYYSTARTLTHQYKAVKLLALIIYLELMMAT